MNLFWEKFGFVIYYLFVTFIFLYYYSSKYNINLSRIGKIIIRFDITNKGKKIWVILLLAVIFLMSLPSLLFEITFEYDWVRILSQIILISIILYRYTFIGLFFGSIGFYQFDDLVIWSEIKNYNFIPQKKSLKVEITLKNDKFKIFSFPIYLREQIETFFERYIK